MAADELVSLKIHVHIWNCRALRERTVYYSTSGVSRISPPQSQNVAKVYALTTGLFHLNPK